MDRYRNYSIVVHKLQRPILFLSVLIFSYSFYLYYSPKPVSNSFHYGSLTAREVAIREAKEKGLKEYTFTTNYIPGIGTIDKDKEIEQFKQQAGDYEVITN